MGAQNNSCLNISLVIVGLIAVLSLGQSAASAEDKIIPPAPDAIGGGNPFQGLGRPDESSPSRRSQFESTDSQASSNPPAGSVNPNLPPDLPPPPTTDPIELQREREEKEKELEEQKKAEAKESEKEKSSKPTTAAIDTPLKKAMLAMQLRNYDQSLSQLDDIISINPKNSEAHYLKAVIYVLTRKYDMAAAEYHLVLKNGPSATLSRKARLGLAKLAR